ncbi:MAG: ATP synthase F1 subunit gamma [Bacteroidales bacterium]|nr:ATP synthase F1 subunit gamma [Bacteroidales bacterium]
MANLKEIRIRLNSVRSIRQITNAMKMVSAAKLRKAQDGITRLRPYFIKLDEIMQHVGSQLDNSYKSIYEIPNESGRVLLIVLTSNRGLCGAFNANIIKRTIQCIKNNYSEEYKNGKLDIISIGKKSTDYFRSKKYPVIENYNHIFDNLKFDPVSELAEKIINSFLSAKYGEIKIIYNQFRNAAVQEITEERFLPVVYEKELADLPESKYETYTDYILEPSIKEIYDVMIPYFLKLQIFRTLLESYASEHGARMTAMHKATDNATDLIKELELSYNKARQAAITKEITEIVSGADALSVQ